MCLPKASLLPETNTSNLHRPARSSLSVHTDLLSSWPVYTGSAAAAAARVGKTGDAAKTCWSFAAGSVTHGDKWLLWRIPCLLNNVPKRLNPTWTALCNLSVWRNVHQFVCVCVHTCICLCVCDWGHCEGHWCVSVKDVLCLQPRIKLVHWVNFPPLLHPPPLLPCSSRCPLCCYEHDPILV